MTADDVEVLADAIVETIKDALGSPKMRAIIDDRVRALVDDRIKALEIRPELHDAGVWRTGQTYKPGAIVTHRGAAWVNRHEHLSTGTDLDASSFRMLVHRGKDGRDLR